MTDIIIRPAEELKGEICAPPSKAYTQRILIAASLSQGVSRISGPLVSDDTEATLRAVKALGARVDVEEGCWTVEGANPLRGSAEPVDCGESGATLRFMIPVAALAKESTVFVLGRSLERRPIEPLLQSLRDLGAETSVEKTSEGKVSVEIKGGGIAGGKTSIRGDVSSQFVSGLMFACPMARNDSVVTLTTPLESEGYVEMTKEVLAQHGVKMASSPDFRQLRIPHEQTYKSCDHRVPGDFSSAAFLLAAAAIVPSKVTVKNLDYQSLQGDKAIIGILKRMGTKGRVCSNSVEIAGERGSLKAIEFDAKNVPDLVPVCTALACYAKGASRIRGAQRLRLKESDRLLSLHSELGKMGAEIAMDENSLTVAGPCHLHGAVIDPHNDHRIAMACAVAALGAQGETRIRDAECVKKSYPRFFKDLQAMGADVVGE